MNLNTITDIKRPASAGDVPTWRQGYAWLAGGTWLFSTPQLGTDTLIDLESFCWPSLEPAAEGLTIGATCTIAELERFKAPPEWTAAPLLSICCRALLMSFKIWNAATVGGNICMSLPAGAMISLIAALEGVCSLWPRDGKPREVKAIDFVTGNHRNVLVPGELLRSIHLPASALTKRFAFRRSSLTHLGRSAAVVIATQSRSSDDFLLTITAATVRPKRLFFDRMPSADELRQAISETIADTDYFDDVHGSRSYKRHLTFHYAEQVREELAQKEVHT